MTSPRDKWNRKYAGRTEPIGEPDPFLVAHVDRLRPGLVLDLASGDGRNSLYLAREGFRVTAVDISDVALARLADGARREGLDVTFVQADLEAPGPPPATGLEPFDSIVIVNYKATRELLRALPTWLAPGGVLLYCPFNTRHCERTGFPRRFCVEPGAHREPPAGLELVLFEDDDGEDRSRDGYLFASSG